MNVFKLTGAKNLVMAEEPVPAPEEGKIRVRITKVMLDAMDSELYLGEVKPKYPLIPGKFAVGLVSEESGHPLFPKGSRVLLHSFLPRPDSGTAKADFTEEDTLLCGYSAPGFLRDFAMVSPDEMTPIPESVDDNKALLVHHIALAKAAVDELEPQKGDHVAVLGADLIGILVCQLLIYQQAAPILIDTDPEKLAFARKCGVYYVVAEDDDVLDNVGGLTGGRLAESVVCTTRADVDPALPFLVAGREGRVVFCGAAESSRPVDLTPAIRKALTVIGVSDGRDLIETAFNLIVREAVDLKSFRCECRKAEAAADFLSRKLPPEVGRLDTLTLV